MRYDRHNFYKTTFCIFREAVIPDRNPDYESNSGSQYWFEENGVYRNSNHWGRAAKCKWRLVAADGSGTRNKGGFAKWSDFVRDNDFDRLYFIRIENGNPHYFHRDSGSFDNDFLRTSGDTQKRLRQIRHYLQRKDFSDSVLSGLIDSDQPIHILNQLHSQNQNP